MKSPCIQVCTIDPASQYCLGCWRTLSEIAKWSRLDDGERQKILDDVSQRKHIQSKVGAISIAQ